MRHASNQRLGKLDGEIGLTLCDHPNCTAPANHRAPKARSQLTDYYWFCLDHIREYNRSWNYCAGLTDTQVETEIRNDTVWRRPSWPLGGQDGTSWSVGAWGAAPLLNFDRKEKYRIYNKQTLQNNASPPNNTPNALRHTVNSVTEARCGFKGFASCRRPQKYKNVKNVKKCKMKKLQKLPFYKA